MSTENHTTLDLLLESLPSLHHLHSSESKPTDFYKAVITEEIKKIFSSTEPSFQSFGPFGKISLPFFKMGAIDSLDLFGYDELIMFAYYWINRKNYSKVLDIGANIGLHSILLSKCGFEVKSYEPDPVHFKILNQNLKLNKCEKVTPYEMAVSKAVGQAEFVRVQGNTTSSHLAGSKAHPYGELERFPVKIEAIQNISEWANLIKMDAEGHEKEILLAIPLKHWDNLDALVEVNSVENAEAIFNHLKASGLHFFAQKLNWEPVTKLEDMPIGHRGGTLFITRKKAMNWND